MNKNNYVNFSGSYYTYLILILTAFLTYSCQDSPGRVSSDTTDDFGISGVNNPQNAEDYSPNKKKLSMDIVEATGTQFKVFDGLGYKNKPEMTKYGMRPIKMIYTSHLWSTKRNDKNKWEFVADARATTLAKKAAKLKSRAVMVDVQNWSTKGDSKNVRRSVWRLNSLYYDLKRNAPNTDFGYFNKVPTKIWWPNPPSKKRLEDWRNRNDRLKGLASKVDIFYLPAYTKSKDRKRWVRNVKFMIEEAKRINNGQPIYVVLWPQYPPRTPKNLRGKYIDKDFWRLQLETVKKYAHGIVLYSPHGKRWNESAAWWKVTKQFMEEIGEYFAKPRVSDSEFTVFDGTRFRNKPEMGQYGFTPIKVIYDYLINNKPLRKVKRWDLPSKKLVKEWATEAKKVNSKISMLNIERWPTSQDDIKNGNVEMSIDRYSKVYDWAKEAEPDMDFGYYKAVPHKLYWRFYPQSHWISSTTKKNERLSPLADKVDAYFVSAYTKTKDRKGWRIKTLYNIKQAHKYKGDKPVYLVMWPQYHALDNPALNNHYIEKDYWKQQLETARKYADGILLWFPYDTKWSEASRAPWWNETKIFLRNMGKAK